MHFISSRVSECNKIDFIVFILEISAMDVQPFFKGILFLNFWSLAVYANSLTEFLGMSHDYLISHVLTLVGSKRFICRSPKL